MGRYLVWLEGIDFSDHVYDTNDLSTIRGGSLTLLASGNAAATILAQEAASNGCKVDTIFSGASQALFRIDAPREDEARSLVSALVRELETIGNDPGAVERAADTADPVPPFAHMRFVTGLAPEGTDRAQAIREAHGRARLAQMRGDYRRPPAFTGAAPPSDICKLDRRRPADHRTPLTAAQVASLSVADIDSGARSVPSSRSTHARRSYGRAARQRFYLGHSAALGWSDREAGRFRFVENFHDMVEWPDSVVPQPGLSVQGKLAVFYADGNGFGAIRDRMGGDDRALTTFAEQSEQLMVGRVLRSSIGFLTEIASSPDAAVRARAAREVERASELRFEVLLFGGDEVCWVAPAWLGLDLVRRFFDAVKDAQVETHPLTFGSGLVLAPYKMPVADSRQLAQEAAQLAKRAGGNRVAIQAFESVEPPAGGLERMRDTLLGGADASAQASALSIAGEEFASFLGDIIRLKTGATGHPDGRPFPLSQLHNMLRAAQWGPDREGRKPTAPRALGEAAANEAAARAFATYRARAGEGAFGSTELIARLGNPAVAAMQAWMLSHLWDYADPFGEGHRAGAPE